HVDRDLRDVGYRIGRPGCRGRGVPAALVAGFASGRRSDARSHAVLVHRASDRVLLAAADLRFMVRADSETVWRRAFQRHPNAGGLHTFYPAGPGRLSSSVRRPRSIAGTEVHRRGPDLRDFLPQPDDGVLGYVCAGDWGTPSRRERARRMVLQDSMERSLSGGAGAGDDRIPARRYLRPDERELQHEHGDSQHRFCAGAFSYDHRLRGSPLLHGNRLLADTVSRATRAMVAAPRTVPGV